MSTDIARRNLDQSLQATSLADLVTAVTDLPMLLVDCSSSMSIFLPNERGEIPYDGSAKTRIQALTEIVAGIRGEVQVTMISFGGQETERARFVDNVPAAGGGTPMHEALMLAREYGATRVVVVSDGAPDRMDLCEAEANKGGMRIDVIFVGTPGDLGEKFLDKLASLTGGTRFTGSLADQKLIAGKVTLLLTGEVEEKRAPIQGEGFSATETEEVDDDELEDEQDDDEDEEEEEDDEDDDDNA